MTKRQANQPFTISPRLDGKPWGGTRLAALGYALPEGAVEPLGEVVVSANQSVISSGPFQHRSLGEVTRENHLEIAGPLGVQITGGRPVFPLLIKLIDAAQHLSIQVHPDDDAAAPLDNTGKTEAWHILDSSTDGRLFLGLTHPVAAQFLADCEVGDGSSAQHLRTIQAIPGETVLIPAGTVHALGAGVMVYEVQQPSEITYRLDDWGRIGSDGRPRERHLAEAAPVIKPLNRPTPIEPVALGDAGASRSLACACRYFALERIVIRSGEQTKAIATGSPQVVTVIDGAITVPTRDGILGVARGHSVVVPATAADTTLNSDGGATLLRAWVPDLPRDIIAPARRAGISDTALASLGVTTP